MRPINAGELLALVDMSAKDTVEAMMSMPSTEYIIVFENRNFMSSAYGRRTAVRAGKGCPIKTWQEVVHGGVSEHQHPVAYYTKERSDEKEKTM